MGALLFVDDEIENVSGLAEMIAEAFDREVTVVGTVEEAVENLHEHAYDAVVMDLFIPLGDHPHRVLGPRARRYQEQVDHLGGLVLLEELDRLPEASRPTVISHTACTDHVLLEIFGDRVHRRVPKPAPYDMLFFALLEILPDD